MLQQSTTEKTQRIARLCLARVVRDGAFVTGIAAELDDLRVGAPLRAAGLKVVPYRGKSFGRIDDIARQLARQGCDAYGLFVDGDTAAATRRIVFQLRKLRAEVAIVLWGDGVVDGTALGAWSGDAIALPYARVEDVVPAFAQLAGVAPSEARPGDDSAYLSGLAPASDLLRLGLTVDQAEATLQREVEWAEAQRLPAESVIPLQSRTADPERLDAICRTLNARSRGLRFRPVAPAELQPAAEEPQRRADHAARLGMNGIVAWSTGIYPDREVGPGIVHLEHAAPGRAELRALAFDQLGDSMLLRSAAVVTGEPEDVMRAAEDSLASDDVGPRGWPRHLYSIRHKRASGAATAGFHEGSGASREFAYVPLHRLQSAAPPGAAALIATLRTREDADELEHMLQRFHREGVALVAPASRPVFFENTCRWIGPGGCSVSLLRRVAVEEDGTLTSCRDAGVVGKSGEAFDLMIARVRKAQQVEEGRRACSTCPVRDECSKCLQLPAIWAGRYCDIRRANPQARLFFELMDLPHLARGHVPEGLPLALRVSYTDLPALFYRGPTASARSGARPVLVAIGEQVLAWRRGERKLIRLSGPLATICEGYWLGAVPDELARELTERFGVELAAALEGVNRGFAQLRAGGLIDA